MSLRNPIAAAPRPAEAGAVDGHVGKQLVYLVYLAMYPIPWFFRPPTPVALAVSGIGIAVFIAVYLHAVVTRPRSLRVYVVASVLIGFALSPFGGVWAVFNVYASSFAGRLTPRRRMIFAMLAVQASLLAFGLITHQPLFNWLPGIFFGVMTGFGTAWHADVEARNRDLQAAQGEVRAMAASAERERIGRDLHDLLGHTLTLVAVKADLAARLSERDPAGARREMEEVAQAAREALGEVRAAVSGMAGAAFAVELDRAKRALAAAQVQAEVTAEATLGDPAREAVLAMALREAVTNVIRHSGARHCRIALDAGPEGALRLSVEDDGRGGEILEGSGLRGMRIRLMAAGGDLQIRSDGAGARLLASLPAVA
jgi:two-component system sensor histidine kinase DesK